MQFTALSSIAQLLVLTYLSRLVSALSIRLVNTLTVFLVLSLLSSDNWHQLAGTLGMDLELSSQVQTNLIMRRMSQQLPRLVGEQELEVEAEVEVEPESVYIRVS